MKDRYRAAIIGLRGGIASAQPEADVWAGRQPLPKSHAAAYAEHPGVDVVAVCDLVPSYLQDYAQTWGPVAGYVDHRRMLEQEQLDIVSVVTGDHAHAQLVVDLAEAGVPAILCEKPLATTLADADRMLAAVEANGVALNVDHTRRWDPFWLAAQAAIASGRIGDLTRIEARTGGARAMLFRNGTHLVDLVCMFARSLPAWLIAKLEDGFADWTEYRGDGGHDPMSEPGVSALVHFQNGVRAHIEIARQTAARLELDLHTTEGRIRISDRGTEVFFRTDGELASRPLGGNSRYASPLVTCIDELVRSLDGTFSCSSTGREALVTLEVLIAMLRSHSAGVERIGWPLVR